MARKIKLTNEKDARYEQKKRTEELIENSKELNELQLSAPSYLKGKARYCYERLAKQLIESKFVKQLDKEILETLSINYQMLQESYDDINSRGSVYVTENGMVKKNPSADIIDKATKNIKALCADLGMSPTSRATILSNLKEDENKDAPSIEDMRKAFGA